MAERLSGATNEEHEALVALLGMEPEGLAIDRILCILAKRILELQEQLNKG